MLLFARLHSSSPKGGRGGGKVAYTCISVVSSVYNRDQQPEDTIGSHPKLQESYRYLVKPPTVTLEYC